MFSISEWFFNNLPLSLIVFVIPIILWILFRKEKTDIIKNQVEIFFKGGTKAYYECEVGKEEVSFKIDETKYNEPIIYNPRIEYKKGIVYRTFLFAEGIGNIDIPPLTVGDRDKIIKFLVVKDVIPKDERKKSFAEYTDADLIKYIQFYNFDIAQLTDKPMMKAFTTSLNFFVSMIDGLIGRIAKMEEKGYSNIAKFIIWVVGVGFGFMMGWAFALKGLI